jgi:hypothetical protein
MDNFSELKIETRLPKIYFICATQSFQSKAQNLKFSDFEVNLPYR